MHHRPALTFFRHWLKTPGRMGAIAPSGPALAKAMVAALPAAVWAEATPILELGGGTGSITAGLLRAGIPAERLIVIERDPALAALLRARFPSCRVELADATMLPAVAATAGIERVSAIVSGLPLLLFPPSALAALVEGCFALLPVGRPLVQFTYGLKSPIDAPKYGLVAVRQRLVLANIPPAFVWTYRRGDRKRME